MWSSTDSSTRPLSLVEIIVFSSTRPGFPDSTKYYEKVVGTTDMDTSTAITLLQAVLILFSAFLVVARSILGALESEENEVGEIAANAMIGVMIAIAYFMITTIMSVIDIVLSSSPEIAGAMVSMENFLFLTVLLLAQYAIYLTESKDSLRDSLRVYGIRLGTAVLFIVTFKSVNITL